MTDGTYVLWRQYQSAISMVQRRGFDYRSEEDRIDTEQSFLDRISVHVTDTVCIIPESFDRTVLNKTMIHRQRKKSLLLMFSNEASVGRKYLAGLVENMHAAGISHCVLIYSRISATARKDIEKLANVRIEIFSEDEMLYNVMEHVLMPEYEVLTREERIRMFGGKTALIKEHQLPKIMVTDRTARYFGLRRNDVVRIIRCSETAGLAVSYRIAV